MDVLDDRDGSATSPTSTSTSAVALLQEEIKLSGECSPSVMLGISPNSNHPTYTCTIQTRTHNNNNIGVTETNSNSNTAGDSKEEFDEYFYHAINWWYLSLTIARAGESYHQTLDREMWNFRANCFVHIVLAVIGISVFSYLFSEPEGNLQNYALFPILLPMVVMVFKFMIQSVCLDNPQLKIIRFLSQALNEPVPFEVSELTDLHSNSINLLLVLITNSSVITVGLSSIRVTWTLMVLSMLSSVIFGTAHAYLRLSPRTRIRQLIKKLWKRFNEVYMVPEKNLEGKPLLELDTQYQRIDVRRFLRWLGIYKHPIASVNSPSSKSMKNSIPPV